MAKTTVLIALACLLGTAVAGEATPGWKKRCLDASADPVKVGANWQLSASPPDVIGSADQIEVAKFEINGTCGIRLGGIGVPLAVQARATQHNLAPSDAVTQALTSPS